MTSLPPGGALARLYRYRDALALRAMALALLALACAYGSPPAFAQVPQGATLDELVGNLDPTTVEAFAAWLASTFGWGATALFVVGVLVFVANIVDQLWPDEKQPAWLRPVLNVTTAFVAPARRWIDKWIRARAAAQRKPTNRPDGPPPPKPSRQREVA